ncbi:SPOR domain-containing protein [Desulfohalovibrio reitneri]|uniref:SPOR domain-containing protein n=1 Tax=Desulfohalovibrio reitneri TaxID=1307759 RepID=UPI00068A2E48|nr:SPOR domain-containing protein [Desulfohalovibrio reitneri]
MARENARNNRPGKGGRNNGGSGGDGEKRVFTIRLTTGKAVGLGFLALLVLGWAFFLGIVLGRGYQPEKAVPEIARIMPEPSAEKAKAPEQPERVLKPEELDYMDSLRKEPVENETGGAEEVQTAETRPEPAPKPEPEPGPTPGPEPEKRRTEVAPQDPAAKAETTAAEPEGQRFDYIYQVASFQKDASAVALIKRIEGVGLKAGLRTAQVKGSTWQRVMVYFRGTPDETEAMKSKLATLGIDRVILKSKKPR